MPYLDNSATTKQHPSVTEAMLRCMDEVYANPSSMHRMGLAAEKLMRKAREQTAKLLGAGSEEIYFTHGGTASDNLAVIGAAMAFAKKGNQIITSKIEHPAVLEACRYLELKGFELIYLHTDEQGFVDIDELQSNLCDKTILVSVMHVNNEIGSIQPLDKIGALVKSGSGAYFHTDAVQSYGKLEIPLSAAKLDMVSASGHKIHGPKGSGFLYIKKGARVTPLYYGGGQEKDISPGTENTPAVAGFGEAAGLASENIEKRYEHVSGLKAYLLEGIQNEIKDIRINSPQKGCSPYILNVSFLGTRAEVMLHMLEREDIYVSAGSACSSNKKGKSHVLAAIGLNAKEAESALRFSFSDLNTKEEIEYTVDRLKKAANEMRRVLRHNKN